VSQPLRNTSKGGPNSVNFASPIRSGKEDIELPFAPCGEECRENSQETQPTVGRAPSLICVCVRCAVSWRRDLQAKNGKKKKNQMQCAITALAQAAQDAGESHGTKTEPGMWSSPSNIHSCLRASLADGRSCSLTDSMARISSHASGSTGRGASCQLISNLFRRS